MHCEGKLTNFKIKSSLKHCVDSIWLYYTLKLVKILVLGMILNKKATNNNKKEKKNMLKWVSERVFVNHHQNLFLCTYNYKNNFYKSANHIRRIIPSYKGLVRYYGDINVCFSNLTSPVHVLVPQQNPRL